MRMFGGGCWSQIQLCFQCYTKLNELSIEMFYLQLLLLHTCAADIFFAIFSLGLEIVIMLDYPDFPFPPFFCPFFKYVQALPLYSSPLLLVSIAYDRWRAICRPYATFKSDKYKRPNQYALLSWIAALILSLPQFIIWKLYDGHGCLTRFKEFPLYFKNGYILYFSAVAWLLPSMLAAFFYFHVCKTVWVSDRNILLQEDLTSTEGNNHNDSPENETIKYVKRIRGLSNAIKLQFSEFDRKRIQTVKLTMTIIACNFFLWSPYILFNICYAFFPAFFYHFSYIGNYLGMLGNLNAAVNPWIFILFNPLTVKKAVVSVVPCSFQTKVKAIDNLKDQDLKTDQLLGSTSNNS
uniref:G_PROTEIN_RECEP_F1_2 domain-containing protein n=1 Tax=Rhabditophanes sp. KR3021 TaxID=114890 RepID=A0AC35THP5_9BILA